MNSVELGTYLEDIPQGTNTGIDHPGRINYVGAIDIGTNSTHLLIAAVDTELKTFSIELAEKSTTRLGEKDPITGELTSNAIDRAIETLKRFKDLAEGYKVENLVTAATSAVREAPNGNEFLEKIKKLVDIEVEIISGTEEARLIYLGVISGMQFGDRPHVIVDIGGGSTELVLADSQDSRALTSTKIGAVRLKTDFIKHQPFSQSKYEFLRTYIQGNLEGAIGKIGQRIKAGENPVMVATSGTAMALGALILNENSNIKTKLQGLKISKSQLDQIIEKLLRMTPQEIQRMTPLNDRRAEIILPGVLILQTTMKMMEINEVVLSERALREGLVVDWMFRNSFLEDRFSLQGNIRQRTVLHQARRYAVNLRRAERVAKHALTLYDNTRNFLHSDDGNGRDLLWAAAILHACGQHINLAAYHKHSWYLIKNCELLGYSHVEHLMVAGIARYHRKSFPKKRHEAWQSLDEKKYRNIVAEMSLILRLSASLDRRPVPAISSIEVQSRSREITIKLIPESKNNNLSLEKWSLQNTLKMSKEYLGIDVKIDV